MINSIYTLNSKLLGQQQELSGIADNISNANTPGFKRLVQNYRTEPTSQMGQPVIQFNQLQGTYIDATSGDFQRTDNPLDLAIEGNGFFAVDVGGRQEFTQNGRFVIDVNGAITTPEGYPLLSSGGGAISVDPNSSSITINRDGTIATDLGTFGQVGVYEFPAGSTQIRTGGTRYISDGGSPLPADPTTVAIAQGFLESSNVNSLQETVRMTELNRAYQQTARAVSNIEELDQRAIRQLGALPQ